MKTYYFDLKPTNPQSDFRRAVMKQCGISESTFYYWMDHPEAVSILARAKIAEISGEEIDKLFPETAS